MSGVDIVARQLARVAADATTRLRTVDTLRRSIARVGGRLPVLALAPPTIAFQGYTSTPAGWTQFSPDAHADKYTLIAAVWAAQNATYPGYFTFVGTSAHGGDGAGGLTANPSGPGRIRFATFAPVLEIAWGDVGSTGQFRLKVDGEYAQAGLVVQAGGGFVRLTWGDGSATYRKLRHYELECFNPKFQGVRCPTIYPPMAWPAEDRLRMVVHGDSMVASVVDSGAGPFLHGATGDVIANLSGQPDCWSAGVGGTGWLATASGTRSTFNQRVDLDVIAPAPDVVWEMGGLNDSSAAGVTQAGLQALVETWLGRVTAALPNVLVLMTGPMLPKPGITNTGLVRDAKAAAAAKYPRNVRFIDNVAAAWVTGTGRQGAVVGDGSADWITGTDGTHPTADGHVHNARRFVSAAALALEGWR